MLITVWNYQDIGGWLNNRWPGFKKAVSTWGYGLSPSAFSGFMLRALQACSRSPQHFAVPRALFTKPVRAGTRPARARIIIRSTCACALRCFTGHSNAGSIRANRASVCASSRSSFLRLSPISRTLRAFATITSCPNSVSKRLIQGEKELKSLSARHNRHGGAITILRRSSIALSSSPASSALARLRLPRLLPGRRSLFLHHHRRHPTAFGGQAVTGVGRFAVTQPVGLPLARHLVARPDVVVRSTDRRRRAALAADRPRVRYHPHVGWDRR